MRPKLGKRMLHLAIFIAASMRLAGVVAFVLNLPQSPHYVVRFLNGSNVVVEFLVAERGAP